ncbi:MAG: hypothetical protein P1R58_12345, partial [bacterium]|nr:hypothetical protein [bacterium]
MFSSYSGNRAEIPDDSKMLTSADWQEPVDIPVPRQLAEIKDDWNKLYNESGNKSPFLSFEYL